MSKTRPPVFRIDQFVSRYILLVLAIGRYLPFSGQIAYPCVANVARPERVLYNPKATQSAHKQGVHDCGRLSGKDGSLLALVLETPRELDEFRQIYDPREPLWPDTAQAHEGLLLDHLSGLRFLEYAPAREVHRGYPPKSRSETGHHRYLWVINDEGLPFVKEIKNVHLKSNLPKHTNLTGGRPAYAGGELWFGTEEALFVSGGSRRYKPIHSVQLEEAVGVFRAFGYTVTSLGWDKDRDEPRRFLWVSR